MNRTRTVSLDEAERHIDRKFQIVAGEIRESSDHPLAVPNQLRLCSGDPENLSELELVEQILSIAVPRERVKKLAFTLIAQFGSYARALSAPFLELETVEGLPEQGIYLLKLVRATVLQTLKAEIKNRPVITKGEALNQYLTALLAHEPREKFYCLFLDSKNRLIAEEMMASGSVNGVGVYPREVIQRALALHAMAIILTHNHPSGDPTPSPDDIQMTRILKNATDPIGITIHDHIIVGSTRLYSFLAEGRL